MIKRLLTKAPIDAILYKRDDGVECLDHNGEQFLKLWDGKWINKAYFEEWGSTLEHLPQNDFYSQKERDMRRC